MKRERTYSQTMRLDLLLQSPPSSQAPSAANPVESMPLRTEAQTPDFVVLLDALYDAAILTDFGGTVLKANGRAQVFFRTGASDLAGVMIGDLISGVDAQVLNTINDNVKTNRFTLLQAHCIRFDQTSFPAEISVTRLELTEAICLCFFVRDITARRQAEEKLRIEGEAIRNAGNGIAIATPDGKIRYANPSMCRLWACEGKDCFAGTNISDHFAEVSGIDTAIAMAAEKQTWYGELTTVRTDGGPLFLQASITASLDEDQQITHFVYSFTDITRRRQDELSLIRYQNQLEDLIRERTSELETINQALQQEVEERRGVEEQLREAIRQLQKHDQAKSAFVSNVSHELRTPLTSLIHSIENLMRGVTGPIPDAVMSYLTMMLEDCWRLDRTIADILDLSRIETGTLQLSRRMIPFARLASRTAAALRISAAAIPLDFQIQENLPPGYAECDAAKIERVLINVLSNAFKFTPAGGAVQVAFEQIRKGGGDAIACTIIDSGVGIPAEFIGRVKERFFRIGEQVGGTGLGLSIAHEIVERHGGGLDIISPPPGQTTGTLVRIWLPYAAPPSVLLAMPEGAACTDLQQALVAQGYEADCATRGSLALQFLRDHRFSIVILDGTLQDMTASEVVLHIKADPTLRAILVLYLKSQPIPAATESLLHGFRIPILPICEKANAIVTKIEETFLPAHLEDTGVS